MREIENEKLFERKMVKEAEAEAHLYCDKEKFLTSAYRKKLDARKEYEEELKRKEAEEAKNDVTKRGDLTGFYANLLNHNLAPDETGAASAARDKAIAGMKGGGGEGSSSSAGADARPSSAHAARSAAVADEDTDPEAGGSGEEDEADAEPPAMPAGLNVPKPKAKAEAAAAARAAPLVDESLASAISAATSAAPKRPAEPSREIVATKSIERRNDSEAVMSARDRYLARKAQKTSS